MKFVIKHDPSGIYLINRYLPEEAVASTLKMGIWPVGMIFEARWRGKLRRFEVTQRDDKQVLVSGNIVLCASGGTTIEEW